MFEQVLLRPLDIIRTKLLRQTLKIDFFRQAFRTRYYRSNCIVCLSFLLNVALMVYFPLWTLLLAPSILGSAHLIESLSSFHHMASPACLIDDYSTKRRVKLALGFFCLTFLSFRIVFFLSEDAGLSQIALFLQNNLRLLDFSVVGISFLYFSHQYRLSIFKRFMGCACLAILGFFLLTSSGLFWGSFIFAHNFMAFAFWYHYAPTRQEKRASLAYLGIFGLIHVIILTGMCDSLFAIAIDQRPTQDYGYSFYSVASELFPKNFNLDFSRKIVALLSFGQGLHYILWIRVIPECRMNQRAPIPFRTRFKKRSEDWGYFTTATWTLIILGFLFAGFFFPWNVINDLFFGLAFFHIYAEYMAFAFNKLNR